MIDECFVYVISIDDLGLSKIGISDNPAKRLRQLSTGSPFRMRIALTLSIPGRDLARSIERAFHKETGPLRLNGEWFEIEAQRACEFMAFTYAAFLQWVLGVDEDDIAKNLSSVDPAGLLASLVRMPRHGNAHGPH